MAYAARSPRYSPKPGPASAPTCTPSFHESLKLDDGLWLALTRPKGVQRFPGQADLELRDCVRCLSTLGRKAKP